jgi:hypothetical protein
MLFISDNTHGPRTVADRVRMARRRQPEGHGNGNDGDELVLKQSGKLVVAIQY